MVPDYESMRIHSKRRRQRKESTSSPPTIWTTRGDARVGWNHRDTAANLVAYSDDYTSSVRQVRGEILEIPLSEEETSIEDSILLKQEAFPIWMDIFLGRRCKSPKRRNGIVSTLTQVYPGSGLTDDQAAAVIGASQTSIIFLTWDPVDQHLSRLCSPTRASSGS